MDTLCRRYTCSSSGGYFQFNNVQITLDFSTTADQKKTFESGVLCKKAFHFERAFWD
tara:strand:+ start:17523 stop:17693 length:171 start_codon:yes stop_codon:yes gene_type:complete